MLALETRALRKSLNGAEALADVDLAIPEGSFTVVLGPAGSGKTSLLKALVGLLEPDSGQVLVRDRPLSRMSRSEIVAVRRDIGVMFQEAGLFSSMDVFDNVAFPLRQHTGLHESQIRSLVERQLEDLGLEHEADRTPLELSTTVKKRVSLARALILEPGIVVCDEPHCGIDGDPSTVIGHLLAARHRRAGGTVVIATRDVQLAKTIGDHIAMLAGGRILLSASRDAAFDSRDPAVRRILDDHTAGGAR